jgi:hypothetical protein
MCVRLRRGAFSLHPLLEERGRIEEARFREWIEIETEWNGMLALIRLLERAAVASHVAGDREPAARAAATEWNRSRAAFSLRSASERLRECTERRSAAFSALCAARLDRRVIEKLEERWQAVWRRRRALNEAAALEDAAMLARTTQ